MLAASSSFSAVATELEHLHQRRESIIHGAFDALLGCRPRLAALLLEGLGDARRAAAWLSSRQRAFSGRTAWDLLAEGDEDGVWDAASRLLHVSVEDDVPVRASAVR
jgi:hypothetical protein